MFLIKDDTHSLQSVPFYVESVIINQSKIFAELP